MISIPSSRSCSFEIQALEFIGGWLFGVGGKHPHGQGARRRRMEGIRRILIQQSFTLGITPTSRCRSSFQIGDRSDHGGKGSGRERLPIEQPADRVQILVKSSLGCPPHRGDATSCESSANPQSIHSLRVSAETLAGEASSSQRHAVSSPMRCHADLASSRLTDIS